MRRIELNGKKERRATIEHCLPQAVSKIVLIQAVHASIQVLDQRRCILQVHLIYAPQLHNLLYLFTGFDNAKIQYNMGTKELDVSYIDESGKRMRIPINQLSDGYKGTISLVADICFLR